MHCKLCGDRIATTDRGGQGRPAPADPGGLISWSNVSGDRVHDKCRGDATSCLSDGLKHVSAHIIRKLTPSSSEVADTSGSRDDRRLTAEVREHPIQPTGAPLILPVQPLMPVADCAVMHTPPVHATPMECYPEGTTVCMWSSRLTTLPVTSVLAS